MYGADIGLLQTLSSLDPERHYPVVLLPADVREGMLSGELDRLGIEFHFVPLGILRRKYMSPGKILILVRDFLSGVVRVRSTARRLRVAFVYVNTSVAVSGALGGRLAGVPVMWHLREFFAGPRVVSWVLHRAFEICTDLLICNSEALRLHVLQRTHGLNSKSRVVYNAVRSTSTHGAGDSNFRKELGLDTETVLIGMVGRITRGKGQEILVEAAALLKDKYPKVHFVAVGDVFADQSHYLDALREAIKNHGLSKCFHVAGYRSDVDAVYRELQIFVLPSWRPEGFGRVTAEAMLNGCAVVATNVGGTPELIEDGVTGLLVPPSDPRSVADAIDRLLAEPNLRFQMGQAAAASAKQRFTLPQYQNNMRCVIDELLITAAGQSLNREIPVRLGAN
jgi:glycosyltransferase involved in cell wall biosynthesis